MLYVPLSDFPRAIETKEPLLSSHCWGNGAKLFFFFKREASCPRRFLRRKQATFRRFLVFAGMASTRGMELVRAHFVARNAAAVPRVFLVGSTRLAAATWVNLISGSAKSNEKKGPEFVAPQGMPV